MRTLLLAGAAALVALPGPVFAQDASDLIKRLEALEKANAEMRAELDRLRGQDGVLRVPAAAAAPAPSSAPADGFRVGDANVKITGFIKADALISDYQDGDTATNALGRDYYHPGTIPVGAASKAEDVDFDAHAKQARIALTVSRNAGGLPITGYVEADFQVAPGTQGSERHTNGYNFGLRRAYISAGSWLFGQDWSTFQNAATMPETADYVGPSEGTVFVRQAQVRKTVKLSDTLGLQLALENPETSAVTRADSAMRDFDDDSLPDVVARLNFKQGKSELSFAAIGRQLSIDGPVTIDPTLASSAPGNTITIRDDEIGWGASIAGKIALGKQDDLRFMVTTGDGIGRYLGLNFGADGLVQAIDGRGAFETLPVSSGFAAFRHFWTADLRSTLTVSMIEVDNPRTAPGSANDAARSAAANLFYTPAKGLDLGVELRLAERETANGQEGELRRLHFVAKSSF